MAVENGNHEDTVNTEAILDFESNRPTRELIDFRVLRLKG